jgi:gas vesicle protein
MNIKGILAAMGVGAAAGAVAIMMMPSGKPTRKLAEKAAQKVEDAAQSVTNKISSAM